jgi:hypothetical protein
MTALLLTLILAPFLLMGVFFIYFSWKSVTIIWKIPFFNRRSFIYTLLGPFSFFFMPTKVKSDADVPWYLYKKMTLRAMWCLLGCLAYGLLLRGLFELVP